MSINDNEAIPDSAKTGNFLSSDQLLFKVWADGKEYRIYTNGRVEGFDELVGISNRFPSLCNDYRREVLAHALECPECRMEAQLYKQNRDKECNPVSWKEIFDSMGNRSSTICEWETADGKITYSRRSGSLHVDTIADLPNE